MREGEMDRECYLFYLHVLAFFSCFYYIAYEYFRLYFIELLFVISLNKLRRVLFCLILISSFCFIGVYVDALNKVIIFPDFLFGFSKWNRVFYWKYFYIRIN